MKLARPDHRAVTAGVILVQTSNSPHHLDISLGCVRIKINHATTLILHIDFDDCTVVTFTKHQRLAHPPIFLKRSSAVTFDHDVRSKSAKVNLSAGFALNALQCTARD